MTTTEAKRVYLQNENNEILLPYSAQALEDGDGNVISETYVKKTDGGFVAKTGDTMSGVLKIAMATSGQFTAKNTEVAIGDTPDARVNTSGVYFLDKNDETAALVQNYVLADGTNGIQLITRKPDNSGWGASFDIATTADGKQSFSKPQIIVAYINGASGCIVWSNGYCEQHGTTSGTSKWATQTITLFKKFANTNYALATSTYLASSEFTNTSGSSTRAISRFGYTNKTVSSFAVQAYNAVSWRACGYLADGEY